MELKQLISAQETEKQNSIFTDGVANKKIKVPRRFSIQTQDHEPSMSCQRSHMVRCFLSILYKKIRIRIRIKPASRSLYKIHNCRSYISAKELTNLHPLPKQNCLPHQMLESHSNTNRSSGWLLQNMGTCDKHTQQ